jgi:hypothetical protein
MITPFIGLSTLIHLILIIIYRLFHLKKSSHLLIYKYRSIRAFLGLSIIFSMFSFIFVSAVFMLHASAVEKHSEIHIIENFIDSHDGQVALNQL